MKITIAFTEPERQTAQQVKVALSRLLPGSRIKENCQHEPFFHIYIATKRQS